MILVVGAGRSGTTAMSRTLQERLGVDMGGPGRRHKSNKTGDYENAAFRQVDMRFERGDIPERMWRRQLRELAAEKVEPWGYKDPRNAGFMAKTLTVFPEAHILWAWREPKDVLGSWVKWYGRRQVEWKRAEIRRRLLSLKDALAGRTFLQVDFTRRVDEEALAALLYTWLTERGQVGLKRPDA